MSVVEESSQISVAVLSVKFGRLLNRISIVAAQIDSCQLQYESLKFPVK